MATNRRDQIQVVFNRGLNLVDSYSYLQPGQLWKASNLVFTNRSFKRRDGKFGAYKPASADNNAVLAMFRFYHLASKDTVPRAFFKTTGADLIRLNTDFDDLSMSTVTPDETSITFPSTTNTTLYTGYAASDTIVSALLRAYQSNSWMYWIAEYANADNADDTLNVPIRCQAYSSSATYGSQASFLHGLVPPQALIEGDVGAYSTLPSEELTVTSDLDAAGPTSATHTSIAIDSDRNVHIAYEIDGAIRYNYRPFDGSGVVDEELDSASTFSFVDITTDRQGNPHIAYYDTVTNSGTFWYATKVRGEAADTWNNTKIRADANDEGTYCKIKIGSDGARHIIFQDATASGGGANPGLEYVYNTSITEIEGGAGDAAFGTECDLVLDSSENIHCVYRDSDNNTTRYATGTLDGGFGTPEDVTGGTFGRFMSIDIDSSGNLHICWINSSTSVLWYNTGTAGSWGTAESVATGVNFTATGQFTSMFVDGNDVPTIAYFDNGSTGGIKYATRVGGSWSIGHIDPGRIIADKKRYVAHVVDTDNLTIHVSCSDPDNNRSKHMTTRPFIYHYRLTAEYDDGRLGESGPSDSFQVTALNAIDATNTNVLDLADTANRYDMTVEVTKIHIYRTVDNGGSDSTYYRAGSVDCTSGVPDSDFTDNVTDVDIVSNIILDLDKFLPPKYKHAVIWKDRAVIANLKTRTTGAADGTALDLEAGGIHKNRIRFSRAFQPDIFPANFFQDILPDGKSGSITGLVISPRIDALLVFMENDVVALTGQAVGNGISSLSFVPRNIANAKGTPSPDSIVEANGDIFYVTKEGIEVIEGYKGRNITSKTVSPLWNELNSSRNHYADRFNMSRIDDVKGIYDSKNNRIMWSYVSGTSTTWDGVLVLDLDQWERAGRRDGVFSLFVDWSISSWAMWDGEGDRGEIFGGEATATSSSWIYRMLVGNEDWNGVDTSDATASGIDLRARTGLVDGGIPHIEKKWLMATINAFGSSASLADVDIRLDIDEEFGGSAVLLDSRQFGASGSRRWALACPRTAIGTRAGLRITIVESLAVDVGPGPFELFDITYTFRPLETRIRPIP